ncbi:MAG TPA: RNA polymerase sigma factor [Candidatus Paceibacterota bacterium]
MYLSAYNSHSDAIFRYCFFKLSDREQALDAVQEIFMKMWKYLQEGNEVQNPQAFLFVIAANHVKDQWRKKKAIPLSVFDGDDDDQPFEIPDEDDTIVTGTEYRLALEHFAKLPDSDRMLLQLRFIEDKAVKDIAAMLGERENTIAVRISRALSALRPYYKNDDHGA